MSPAKLVRTLYKFLRFYSAMNNANRVSRYQTFEMKRVYA